MFTFQIRYIAHPRIYLSGIRGCLDNIVHNQSHREYCFSPYVFNKKEEIHLLVIDATCHETINDFPVAVLDLLKRRSTLMLVNALQKTLIEQLEKAHCCSVLCVDEMTFDMRDILEMTMHNKRYLSPLVMRIGQQRDPEDEIALTPSEYQVMKYFGNGLSGVEISKRLFRSEKTISSHKRRIMKKLGARSDVELCQKIDSLKNKLRFASVRAGEK
ncbi:response regulator transcription factor [Enterobacter sp. 118C5]|uniref:response regulator transcription factor n=1 Tax=Enterobacter TaxID=547 RepID=UPI002A82F603|nr:LuxR C-terminal-related transcriptional regulator [Enterobacter sp. 118C5]